MPCLTQHGIASRRTMMYDASTQNVLPLSGLFDGALKMSRRWNAARYVAIMFVSLVPARTFAQVTASFQGVGDLPGGSFTSQASAVSPDGTVVVGYSVTSNQNFPYQAFRWTAGTAIEMLETTREDGSSNALAASAFGTIIVGSGGYLLPSGAGEAVVWEGGHVRPLTGVTLVGAATDVTPDGAVIIGSMYTDLALPYAGARAFRFCDGVVESLGTGNYGLASYASGVSSDGSVVVGSFPRPDPANPSQHTEESFRWTLETGMVGLGWLTGYSASNAYGVSADGSTVVGICYGVARSPAFRWKDGVMTDLGGLTADDHSSTAYATATSSDGWRVVGRVQGRFSGDEAFLWDPVFGMRRIADVLTDDYGVDLKGWELLEAFGMSDDGQTIVGTARNPDGNLEGFVATIPSWTAYTIIKSDPPDGIIDARQDLSASGLTRRGFDRVRIYLATAFRDPVTHGPMVETNFTLTDSLGLAPTVVGVVPVPGQPTTFDIVFSDPINPGAWTVLSFAVERPDGLVANESLTIGFLPGDVNGDGTSNARDITALIDSLNTVPGRVRPPMSTDINGSGATNAQDIVRLIDLLNGVNTSHRWLNARLPPRP